MSSLNWMALCGIQQNSISHNLQLTYLLAVLTPGADGSEVGRNRHQLHVNFNTLRPQKEHIKQPSKRWCSVITHNTGTNAMSHALL